MEDGPHAPEAVNNQPMQVEQPKIEEPHVITAEERLWGAVKANPADFNAWTELIQETEKLEDIARIRTCYDTFLAEFPLCYGYWKKYADYEGRLGTPEKIIEVYERAVKAVTHSVDIWVHYYTYISDKYDAEEQQRLLERGISAVGTDYLSHILWDKYLEYASRLPDLNLVMELHTRILDIPLQHLDRYYTGFKQLSSNKAWLEANPLPLEELERFIAEREAMFQNTKEWDAKIRDFEIGIRRPYFHVKPLDDVQLGNWHKYLDFLEKEGETQKVIKLFERCLIACANYPEYWIRYVEYLERQSNLELASDALQRASQIFVKRLPETHIFAARFRERNGEIAAARKTYKYLTTELAPGHLEIIIKAAHFEKRQGDVDGACEIFESAIEIEKSKEGSRTLQFLLVQYVQFLFRVGRTDKVKEALDGALETFPHSKILIETAIHYESHHGKDKELDRVKSIVERATKTEEKTISHVEREDISNIYLEFVDCFGDISTIMEAESRHESLFPFRKSYVDYKRRFAHDHSLSNPAKVQKSSSPATQGYAQWNTTAYAQTYPQNWQQQTQQAQYPYTQQTGYPYGTYATYGAQQGQTAYAYGSQDMNGWTAPTTGTTW